MIKSITHIYYFDTLVGYIERQTKNHPTMRYRAYRLVDNEIKYFPHINLAEHYLTQRI